MPRGRKIMKGGDWTDYFRWTNWSDSENSGQYTTSFFVLLIFGLLLFSYYYLDYYYFE